MKRLRLLAASVATTATALAILLVWQITAHAQKPAESSELVNPLAPNVGSPITSPPKVDGMMMRGGRQMDEGTTSAHSATSVKPNKPQELKVLTIANAPATDLSNSIRLVFQSATIAAEPVSNSIIIRGEPEELKAIEALALKLDEAAKARASTTVPPQSHKYPLDPEQANSVLAKLRSLFADSPEINLAFDPSNNQLVTLAPPNQQAIIKAMLEFGQLAANQPQPAESNPNERNILAQIDGIVAEVLVNYGDEVKAGQELLKLKNPELEMRIKQYATDIDAQSKTFELLNQRFKQGRVAYDEIPAAEAALKNLKVQAELDQQKLKLLTIKSPIDGKVATENLREKLIERPVTKGEVLLAVKIPSNDLSSGKADPTAGLVRREVSAHMNGVVKQVLVNVGEYIKEGDPLLIILSPERIQELDLTTASERRDSLQKLLEKHGAVRSPVNGIVVSQQLHEKLINREVRRGDSLVTIAVTPMNSQSTSSKTEISEAQTSPIGIAKDISVANPAVSKAEQKANKLAAEYRKLTLGSPTPLVDPKLLTDPTAPSYAADLRKMQKNIDELKAEIRCEVEIAFNARQKSQTTELDQLRKRLNQIEATISTREKHREAIINRRVEELINPDVKWDAGTAARPERSQPPTQNQQSIQPALSSGATRLKPVFEEREAMGLDGKKTTVMESRMVEEEVVANPLSQGGTIAPQPVAATNRPYPAQTPPEPLHAMPDQVSILGEWKVESGQEGGKPTKNLPSRMVITKEFVIITDSNKTEVATYTLDPSKDPKWIDFRSNNNRDLAKGIYKLHGDELVICVTKGKKDKGEDRPTSFESKPDSPNDSLLIFKRETPQAPAVPASAVSTEYDPFAPLPRLASVQGENGKLLALQLSESPVYTEPDAATAQQLLQGKWSVFIACDEGENRLLDQSNIQPSDRLNGCVIDANSLTFQMEDGTTQSASFKLDPKHYPAWIDLEIGGRVFRGIYELNPKNATLAICYAEGPAKKRSTGFHSGMNSENDVLLVFRRASPAQ